MVKHRYKLGMAISSYKALNSIYDPQGFCAQGLLLAVIGIPYEMLEMEARSAVSKLSWFLSIM